MKVFAIFFIAFVISIGATQIANAIRELRNDTEEKNMIIKIETSREFIPTLLDEFKNNPNAINDMADHVAKNAKAIAKEALEDATGPAEKYLKESNITLKVSVEFGNTEDFSDNLSERMTIEERNKVRKIYSDLIEGLNLCHEDCVCDAIEGLEEIFDKEFLIGEEELQ